eukprot:1142859-Pelagomonas_calceolata.AAC.11
MVCEPLETSEILHGFVLKNLKGKQILQGWKNRRSVEHQSLHHTVQNKFLKQESQEVVGNSAPLAQPIFWPRRMHFAVYPCSGELSLGLWSQLIGAFARLGRDSPELCDAATRQASVSIQYTLLQLGQVRGQFAREKKGKDREGKGRKGKELGDELRQHSPKASQVLGRFHDCVPWFPSWVAF